MMDWLTALDWTGSALGLLGSTLLASQTRLARYGFVTFLAANFATATLAWSIHRHGLFSQQIGFTLTSLLGLVRTGLLPIPRRIKAAATVVWSTLAVRFARRSTAPAKVA